MSSSSETDSLDSLEIKRDLLLLSDEIDSRVSAWRYPSAEDVLKSEKDPDILADRIKADRIKLVFQTPFQELFARRDLDQIIIWLHYRSEVIADELTSIVGELKNLIPAADAANPVVQEELVVRLADAAHGIRRIAKVIPDAEGFGHVDRDDLRISGDYKKLMQWATEELKGKQRKVIELVVDSGGEKPISEIASDAAISWCVPYANAWNSIRKALNKKLKKAPERWRLSSRDSNATLSKIGQK